MCGKMTKIAKQTVTNDNRKPFHFQAQAPRNYFFESVQCMEAFRQHSPLSCGESDIDKNFQKKDLAVLFLRRDFPSRSSFQDKSADEGPVQDKYNRILNENSKCSEHINHTKNKDKRRLEHKYNEKTEILKEQESQYTICKNSDLKKREPIDSDDSDEYQECFSNVPSSNFGCKRYESKRLHIHNKRYKQYIDALHRDLSFKNHLMQTRETQTSLKSITNAYSSKVQNEYDRALTINYGKHNYMPHQNQNLPKLQIPKTLSFKSEHLPTNISKDNTDLDGEYMIKCLNYTTPAELSFNSSKESRQISKYPLRLEATRTSTTTGFRNVHSLENMLKCRNTDIEKMQDLSDNEHKTYFLIDPKKNLAELLTAESILEKLQKDKDKKAMKEHEHSKKTVEEVKSLKLSMRATKKTTIEKKITNKKHMKSKQQYDRNVKLMKPIRQHKQQQQYAQKYSKKDNNKEIERYYKNKLLEIARNDILGKSDNTVNCKKKTEKSMHRNHKISSALREIAESKKFDKMNSNSNSSLIPNMAAESMTNLLERYEKPPPFAQTNNIKKTRKLKR